jgi:pseudaminic acid cytidylyltransferase
MKALAIIPARGGSKRIPGKNIKEFCGFPIIKYSIDVAIKSGCFDEVMVSTEDKKIARIAKKYGAKIPFFRSKETSCDDASTGAVVKEVLESYKKINLDFDYVCCIYPTAPFITGSLLNKAYGILKNNNVDSVIPIVKYDYPIQRALKVSNNKVQMICPENEDKRSQDLEEAYHDVGQFYWLRSNSFLKKNKIFTDKTMYIELPVINAQDIDTEQDWEMAEIKYKILLNNKKEKKL